MERDDVISLQDYLLVLRRRRWVVLATTGIVIVVALLVAFAQTPLYEAETEVVVEPVRRTQDVTLEQLLSPATSVVQTERLVVTSRPVADRVAEQVGSDDVRELLEQVRVEAVGDTRVVRILATDEDPALAAAIADGFAEAYLEYRRDEAMTGLVAARANLDERAANLRAQIDELDDADEVDEVQRDALLAQLASVVAQSAELGDLSGTVSGGGAILSPAEIPESPVSPRPVRTGALAVVLGLLLGVGLAFLRDHVDDVIRDEADFKRATGDRPILGRIPAWSDPEGGERLATVLDPASLASESYRELSAGVRFLLLAHNRRHELPAEQGEAASVTKGSAIMMASATAGDGKSSTAANLAVAAARVGLRTLLVDADLRRPTIAKRFGLGRTTGLSDLLLRGDDLKDHVVSVGIENLRVLPAGTIPPNPNELLASPAMRLLEEDVLRRVDLVIYDSPAVLAVPDALELGRHVDVAIVVARAGTTSRRHLSAAMERLQQVGTDVAGTVLNGLDLKTDGYYYGYYQEDESAGAAGSGSMLSRLRGRPKPSAGPRSRRERDVVVRRAEREPLEDDPLDLDGQRDQSPSAVRLVEERQEDEERLFGSR